MTEGVAVFEKRNGVGVIRIRRPEKLNALNREVIETVMSFLKRCERDEEIRLVVLEGEGDRAFSAGGDVKSVYEMAIAGDVEGAVRLFRLEFDMDFYIANYPKTVISLLDGITMGGGVGMTISSDFRVVTERTKWAMPEMKIGLFPDVGTSYYLSRLPGGMGHFVCLTSRTFGGDDCLYLGVADYKVDSADCEKLKERLFEMSRALLTRKETERAVAEILREFSKAAGSSYLERHSDLIARYFDRESLREILDGLRAADSAAGELSEREREFVRGILTEMEGHSPSSMAVVMEQHRRARKGMTVKGCLDQDAVLVGNFLRNHDFYEGVRVLLVEKTGMPEWQPERPEEVDVLSYFIAR